MDDDIDQALLDALPCTAHQFSTLGHKLGLVGAALGKRKRALHIATIKGDDGRWHCVHIPGYEPPPLERPSMEEFGVMGTRASKAVKGGNIGGGKPG